MAGAHCPRGRERRKNSGGSRAPLHGFQGIDVPGAFETFAQGINGNGDVVGNYLDGGFHTHGFLMQ